MAKGEGKGWSKGRTAANDPRIARAAAAHVGRRYVRRTPFAETKWGQRQFTKAPIEWSPAFGYIVGLIATDGCLLSGSRAINFKSADRQLVETFLSVLGRTNRVHSQRTRSGGVVYFAQFKDTRMYGWLQSVGLTPRKSLTLGALDVPEEFLAPLVRGLLDGDGNISNGTWRADTSRRSDYYYETLRARFVSASRPHLDWLQEKLRKQLGLRGWIWMDFRRGHSIGCLAYGKHDSLTLLTWLYTDRSAPCLIRKRDIWDSYLSRHANFVRENASTIYG